MSLNPTRREMLIGAAAVATTAAMPGAAIANSLAEQAEFAAIRFPLWDLRGVFTALTLLEHRAGVAGFSPDTHGHDADLRRGLRYCVFAGWAVPTGSGRFFITEVGRREYEAERFEWYS